MSATRLNPVAIVVVAITVGCEPPPRPAAKTPASVPTDRSTPSSSQPVVATSPAAPAPIAPATSLTLEAAHELQLAPAKRLIALFDSVQDEASARAAAPQIQQAGQQLSAGMKSFKATVAAHSLSGKDAEVDQFFQQKVERQEMLGEINLVDSIERVVSSPQGPLLRNEINGLLDGMLEAATSGDRRGLEHAIQQKQLRR